MQTQKHFVSPEFSNATLEFRFEDNVICIYGTQEGLQWLIKKCEDLVALSGQGHVHIGSTHVPGILTKKSLEASITILSLMEKPKTQRRSFWEKIFVVGHNLSNAGLELRFEDNNAVCIRGTQKGLQWLIKQFEDLINFPNQGHIHIDSSNNMEKLLTKQSLDAAIAIFTPTEKPNDKRQSFWSKETQDGKK